MRSRQMVVETLTSAAVAQISPGVVMAVPGDGAIIVACPDRGHAAVPCSLLVTSEGQELLLAPGDTVLLWLAGGDEPHGVVLGRIGPSCAGADNESEDPQQVPDEIVLEAKHNLILRCGEGSITLRGDGKVLVKGKDLVSHAQGMNRIKGGGVAIN